MAYGVAKYAAGRLAEMLCRSLALDFVHMRILSVYGINDGANTLISYLIRSYLNNERPQLTAGEQLWDYLYADDAARDPALKERRAHHRHGQYQRLRAEDGKAAQHRRLKDV